MWESWGSCSSTCGDGGQTRSRRISIHEENGGTACTGASVESQMCNTGTCPTGKKIVVGRYNNCYSQFIGLYKYKYKYIHTYNYNLDPVYILISSVIVSCVWGMWDDWSNCSRTCGGGTQSRSRRVVTHEENGGTACSGPSSQSQVCNTGACPPGKNNLLLVSITIAIPHLYKYKYKYKYKYNY